jgi:hypothetical protein
VIVALFPSALLSAVTNAVFVALEILTTAIANNPLKESVQFIYTYGQFPDDDG